MYEMYTKAGDRACQAQVNKIKKSIQRGKGITPDVIEGVYEKALSTIAVKHPEVYDTEPAWHIRSQIKKELEYHYYNHNLFL